MIHFLPNYGPGHDGRWLLQWRLYGTTPGRARSTVLQCDRWNNDRWWGCRISVWREVPALRGRMRPPGMVREEHSGSRIHLLHGMPEYLSRRRGNGETSPRRWEGQSLRSERAPASVHNSCSTIPIRHQKFREGRRPGAPDSVT